MSRALLAAIALGGVLTAGCETIPPDPMRVEHGQLTVDNRTASDWTNVEIWINRYFRAAVPKIAARSHFEAPLNAFVSGYGQRFDQRRLQIDDLRLEARDAGGEKVTLVLRPQAVGLSAIGRKK